MINWKRVFEQIWTQIRWLQSYGQINELALRTIMKKFSNNFLAIKDNTLNQKLGAVIDSKAFKVEDGKMKEELHILSDDILKFYAACFCGGKVPQARRELDGYKDEIRPKDSKQIYFLLGTLFMLAIVFIFLLIIPAQNDPGDATHWNEIYSGIDTYYITLMICFMLFSTAVNVDVYKRYRINYGYIFEIHPHAKMMAH